MSTEFSSLEGHQYVPGEEPTHAERMLEILVSLAPYASAIAGVSLLMIFLVVVYGVIRKRRDAKDMALKDAPPEMTAAQRAKFAERQRLQAAFDARQEAAAQARADLRARHFGTAST